MTLTISPALAAPQVATAAPAVAAQAGATAITQAAQPTARPAAAPQGQQQAALNQLLAKYKYGQSHGVAASALSSLGRQILAEAKTLGQRVTLPRAPAGSGAAAPAPTQPTGSEGGKVNVTA